LYLLNLGSNESVFFKQKRVGKNNKYFIIYKFRSMVHNADKIKKSIVHLNEADGPVFKITDDPRYTKVGKILARTGLDELPQLINVIKGEMSIVGPRPLPKDEAIKLSPLQKKRHLIKPGITSRWVVEGSHNLTFDRWMNLDIDYVKNATIKDDFQIIFKTFTLIITFSFNQIVNIG
jgi:lipopolysaccharide/colanic/teichoic acid biosynthesis glycosyltransferase